MRAILATLAALMALSGVILLLSSLQAGEMLGECGFADLNDYSSLRGSATADWSTGERPAYTCIPSWGYGMALCGLSLVVAWSGRVRFPPREPT